ncbi:MAG: TetR/AcrR family transcriptional regulator [Actinomycetota bacterium]
MAAVPIETTTTRDRLVAAAIEVFREQGYDRARVQDIARGAGLTTGAIYANYRGKADLLFEAIGTRVGAEVDALLAQAKGEDAREVLERLGGALLHRGERPPLLLDAFAAARRDPELATLVRDRIGQREAQLTNLVARAKHDGAVDGDLDTDALARFCITLAMGALVLRSLDLPPVETDDWQSLIHRLLESIKGTP